MAEAVAVVPAKPEDNKKEVKPKLPPLPPAKIGAKKFAIRAEGAMLPFDEVPIERGESRGQVYLVPTSASLAELTSAFGEQKVLETFVHPRMKIMFQNFMDEATSDEGVFSEDDFIKLTNELSARGDTFKELFERQSALAEEMTQYDFENSEHIPILQRIARQMKTISEALKAKKKKKSKEDQEAESAAKNIAAA